MYIYYKLGCVVTIGRKFCETQLPNAWKSLHDIPYGTDACERAEIFENN